MAKPNQHVPVTEQIARAQAAKAARPVNLFTVPEDLRVDIEPDLSDAIDDVVEIGMRILTPGEERLAIKRAGGEVGSILYQLNCASLVSVKLADDSERLHARPGDAESSYNRMHPKIRNLVTEAYNELHRAKEEQSADFLKTRQVRV